MNAQVLGYLNAVRPHDLAAATRAVYAAAKTTLATGSWKTSNQSINSILNTDAATIRARVRQLVRDFPHAARAVQILTDLTVGDGIKPQPAVTTQTGEAIPELNRQIEEAWKRWVEEADLGKRWSFYEMQTLAKRSEVETGEFFFAWAEARDAEGVPLRLAALDPDRVQSVAPWRAGRGEQPIHQGVEYSRTTGEALAYYVTDAEDEISATRWPAETMLHGYAALRPGQLRGVSPLAPAVILYHSLRDFLEAEIDGARLAARYLAWIASPDPAGTMAAFGAAADSDYTDSTGDHAKIVEEMGVAIKEYLAPGEQVTLAEHNRPGDQFTPFVTFVLKTLAAVTQVSYELLSGDYQGLNYSVLRGVRNDLAQQLRVHHARLVRQLCQPVYRRWLNHAVMRGQVAIPDYFTNPFRYHRAVWQGPGLLPVDPLKEIQADADAMQQRVKSGIEVIRARGRDPDDVLDEIADWEAKLEARGLAVEDISTALASNPAALMDTDDTDEDEPERAFRVARGGKR